MHDQLIIHRPAWVIGNGEGEGDRGVLITVDISCILKVDIDVHGTGLFRIQLDPRTYNTSMTTDTSDDCSNWLYFQCLGETDIIADVLDDWLKVLQALQTLRKSRMQ